MSRPRPDAAARKAENRARVAAYKIRIQCVDCPAGVLWPSCALQLDHLPGTKKVGMLSDMMGCTWEKIAAEIAKTEVVCANHHAIRTSVRAVNSNP